MVSEWTIDLRTIYVKNPLRQCCCSDAFCTHMFHASLIFCIYTSISSLLFFLLFYIIMSNTLRFHYHDSDFVSSSPPLHNKSIHKKTFGSIQLQFWVQLYYSARIARGYTGDRNQCIPTLNLRLNPVFLILFLLLLFLFFTLSLPLCFSPKALGHAMSRLALKQLTKNW